METAPNYCYCKLGCRRGILLTLFSSQAVINFCFKFGLIGSTEWGEDFADWIDKHVVAYLNLGKKSRLDDTLICHFLTNDMYTDASVYGSQYRVHATPSLSHLVRTTAQRIAHPTDPNRTLWDARMDTGTLVPHVRADANISTWMNDETDSLGVVPLGSGSDFTVFLQHIGVSSHISLGAHVENPDRSQAPMRISYLASTTQYITTIASLTHKGGKRSMVTLGFTVMLAHSSSS